MAALTRRRYQVQPFKAGPDYIDPSYHQIACGVPSRNLDTWLLPHPTVLELFQRAAGQKQISIVEGVMGVFDGHSNLTEVGSTAELAKLLNAPVILVADAGKVARSVAAEVLGYQLFDPDLRIAGVILNGVGSPRHLEFCQPQIEATTGLPVVGYLPRREEFIQPERHLGLIPTVEGTVANLWYDAIAKQVEETFDLDRIIQIASTCNPPPAQTEAYPLENQPKKARIAIAQDKAFSFYYQDSLDLLEAWGAELIPFSPLEDQQLPPGAGGIYIGGGFPEMFAAQLAANAPMLASIRDLLEAWGAELIPFSPLEDQQLPPGAGGIYIGGGFPEMFAAQLAANAPMLASIRDAVDRGVPVYGECGGLMYLGRSLSDLEGNQHPMVGAIPAVSAMSDTRLVLGYREVESRVDNPLMGRGQRVRAHEFHWSTLEAAPTDQESVYRVVDQENRPDGFHVGSVWASYVHIHLGSDPSLARRFVDTCSVGFKAVPK
jgi:cobyrinic acid a,c-diamide synthase